MSRTCNLCGQPTLAPLDWVVHTKCDRSFQSWPRWLLVAMERIAAGEPEREVMEDYGYRWVKR